MKTCTMCNTPKPLEDFYKRTSSKDGLMARCIACVKIARRRQYPVIAKYKHIYYAKHHAKLKDYQRKYEADKRRNNHA